jgi:hypothetical protein
MSTTTISPGVRAAVLGGFAASLVLALHPAHASPAFTGDTSTVLNGRALPASPGSLAFTGETSTVTVKPSQIAPAAGALVFTPDTAGVTYGIAPAKATLSSAASTSRLYLYLHPAATASTFTGESATLSQGVYKAPGFCVALLRGGQSTIFKGVAVAPAAASAAFSLETATLSQGVFKAPGVCVALLRGARSTIFKGVTVAPAAAAAALGPETSSLSQNRVLFPWRGALLLIPGASSLTPTAGALASLVLRNMQLSGNLAPYNYHSGDTAVVSIAFLDANGIPLDPATVSLAVTPPYTAPPTISVTRDSIGHYHANVPLPSPGIWTYQWGWTGAAAIGGGNSFLIVN